MLGDATFELIVIAIDEYGDPGWAPLPPLTDAAQVLLDGLRACGAADPPITPLDHRASTLRSFLTEWSVGERGSNSTFLYWGGHGESTADEHWLVTSDARNPPSEVDGLVTADLARFLREDYRRRADVDAKDGQPWTVVVLDCCGARLGVQRIARELLDRPMEEPRALALLGTHGDGTAYSGHFAVALHGAIGSYAENDRDIPILSLLQDLAERLGPDADLRPVHLTRAARMANPRHLGVRLNATIDVRDELRGVLAGLAPALRSHFLPKAQGAELGELAWYFSGRRAEARRLVDWLRSAPDGLLVVTGAAGSGKSALLGRTVTLADRPLSKALRRAGLLSDIAEDERPPAGVFDAVVHLSGKTLEDTAAELATALIGPNTTATGVETLIAVLGRRRPGSIHYVRRRTVLVDALDEARDPLAIARTLLQPLTRVGFLRLVVGTRQSLSEGIDLPETADRELLDALGADDAQTMFIHHDPTAVAEYVTARLLGSEGSAYADLPAIAGTLGRLVAERNEPFLFARLAAAELLQRSPYEPGSELQALLAGGHRGLFAATCERLGERSASTLSLLRALAFGLGRGLPRADRIWATVAEALGGANADAATVDLALQEAAAYIALDGEDGQSTYRLAHQTFAEHFGAGTALDERGRGAHARTTAELQRVGARNGWGAANPYLIVRLPEHAARAGRLAMLLDDVQLLDNLDPYRLATELERRFRDDDDVPVLADACIRGREDLAAVRPSQRAALRALMIAKRNRAAPPREPDALLWPRWADGTPYNSVAERPSLRGHSEWVRTLAFGLVDGRVVLASGASDATIRLWDPATSTSVGEPLRGHRGPVCSVAFGMTPDGSALLASASEDETVALWDPALGKMIGKPLRAHLGVVRAVAFGTLHGRAVLASAGEDRMVRLWDPEALCAIGQPVHRHRDAVSAVAFGSLRGRLVLASASVGGDIWLWDAETATAIGDVLSAHSTTVSSLAFGVLDDRLLLASASVDGTIRLWDPETAAPVAQALHEEVGGARPMGFGLVGDRLALAVAGADGMIRLWDVATETTVGGPVRGPASPVSGVALAHVDHRLVLASGGVGRTVRLWDLDDAGTKSRRPQGHSGPVLDVAFGTIGERVVLASAGEDSACRIWDPLDATLIGRPWRGHSGVRAIAFGLLEQRSVLVCAGTESTVALWDPVERTLAAGLLRGLAGPLVSVAFGWLDECALVAAANADGIVMLWDPTTGQVVGRLLARQQTISPLAFGVLDERLVLASISSTLLDRSVLLWDPARAAQIGPALRSRDSQQPSRTPQPAASSWTQFPFGGARPAASSSPAPQQRRRQPGIASIAFGAPADRGRLACGATDGTVNLWDITTATEIVEPLRAHEEAVTSLAFGMIGDRLVLASASSDATVKLWDATTATAIGAPFPTLSSVNALAVGPESLAIATDDGLIALDVAMTSTRR